MNILTFQAEDVRRIVEHTILHFANQSPIAYTKDKFPKHPSVILVHDQGVYLMSNAKERDLLSKENPGATGCFVAYAEGCHPHNDEDWWDNARDLVGGDDFAETLDWAIQIKQRLDAGAKEIRISVTPKRLELLT